MLNYFKSKLPPQVSSAFAKTPTPTPAPTIKKEKSNYRILGLTEEQKAKIDKNINDIRQSIKYVTLPKLKDLIKYDLEAMDGQTNEDFILYAGSTSANLKECEASLRYLKERTNEVIAVEQEAKNAFRGRLRGNTRVNKPTNTVTRKNRKTRRR